MILKSCLALSVRPVMEQSSGTRQITSSTSYRGGEGNGQRRGRERMGEGERREGRERVKERGGREGGNG